MKKTYFYITLEEQYKTVAADRLHGYTVILILGLSLFSVLLNALVNYEKGKSITDHMKQNPEYRLLLSVIVILHCFIWSNYAIQNRVHHSAWLLAEIILILVVFTSWMGLIIYLSDTTHFIFVSIFISCFTLFLCLLLVKDMRKISRNILLLTIFSLFVCGILMVTMLQSEKFFIPEYGGGIIYSVGFTLFLLFEL